MVTPGDTGPVGEVLTSSLALARSILGTTDPAEVARRVDAFCRTHFDSGLAEVFLCELSVGAAFGLRVHDGRRILLKAHRPDRPLEFLAAVFRVQNHLRRRGFPCPRPSAGPAPLGPGLATAEEFLDEGWYADAHDPEVRRAMARTLARLTELAGEVPEVGGLTRGWTRPGRGELWPTPHNALFDFESTARGAEWIDELGAEAKRVLDDFRGEVVVGHADWSSKHLRFAEGEVRVVYDWDSLRLDEEAALVGAAAVTFPANRHLGASNLPSPEETQLFVEEYEAARGVPFSRREREAVAAAAIYAMAYLARSEHASDPEGENLAGNYREKLPSHAEAYLRSGG